MLDPRVVLFRQIHPSFCNNGKVSSQAFTPFPKDENLLSMYDGSMVSAEKSFEHYTESLKYQSVGVYGVMCHEVTSVNLSCRSDPLDNFPEHAIIDFTGQTNKEIRKLAKRLRDYAATRGCIYSRQP
jgi:hypothetical protein